MSAPRQSAAARSLGRFSDLVLPKLVIAPTVLACLIGFYGFIGWTAWLSFTNSRLLPRYEWAGLIQYERLFADERWWHSMQNLAVFGGLFVGISLVLGLLMAVLLDQKIRGEGYLRTIYLYPMALSFIVTGTAWKWILNPGLGLEKVMHDLGWTRFNFDWIVNPDYAIYTVVLAGVWQSSGFVMALFLAGLRGVDESIIKAAQIDGASLPRIYLRIIIPSLRPVFLSAFMILTHIAVKSFDLVMALTGGGPGFATDLPSIYMYQHGFTRGQLGLGAASAMMMLFTACAIVMPLLYSELRSDKRA
ncbi:sugar ABC transporter permease [Burkholderiaceae bacterium DAT-1]|nr:sugar ABC transporter permease [Burkholderiaceae bacterium DAT-1]